MIAKLLAALVTVAVIPGASAVAVAANNPVAPQMNTGSSTTPPKIAAVSPKADQIAASDVIGARVEDPAGDTIAKITDIAIDRRSGAAAVAVLAPQGGESFNGSDKSAVAWSSLKFEPTPTPHFVTRLDPQALAAGAALVAKAKNGSHYFNAKTDLLGKAVVGANGETLGHIDNLVLTFGTGKVVALVIRTGGAITIGANDHAVAWSAANPQTGNNGGPVHVALTKAQVEGAPLTATLAPAPIPPKPGSGGVQVQRGVTGAVNGLLVPAPTNRR